MKIAIFHNLRAGGGLEYVSKLTDEMSKLNIKWHIYTHQENLVSNKNKIYSYPLIETKNIFDHVKQTIIETKKVEKQISIDILRRNYDFIFVFPCHLQQCPNIINFLPKQNTYYFYLENIREFYEKTSFNYFNIKQTISRIIRWPIKRQDYNNCINALNIISDSYYSNYQLSKIYNKKSKVIYPGMKNSKPRKVKINNNHKSLSFGLLSMLKGHHLSAQIDPTVEIFGTESHENVREYLNKNVIINSNKISDDKKSELYKSHSIYFANQINEPYGLTTLEATSKNCFVLGRNEGGTPEIISNGNNGFLYDTNNIDLAQKLFKFIQTKETITMNKLTEISWTETLNKILDIIKYA